MENGKGDMFLVTFAEWLVIGTLFLTRQKFLQGFHMRFFYL